MPVMMAVPAVPVMVVVSNLNHNLRLRCRYQRREKQHRKESKGYLLHA
jgi:hypothetical protein